LIEVGTELVLSIEKPAAGGRMLARHDGQVVLVSGTIPGERVRTRVERAAKSVLYASTTDVVEPSPDRRSTAGDGQCGGNVFSHIVYERQRLLKGDILREALQRIGRVPLRERPDVMGSPERGYRMRARLHARGGRLGFFREGTHELCDAGSTGQLLPAAVEWIAEAQRLLEQAGLTRLSGVELSENIAGDERACHLLLDAGVAAPPFAVLAGTGLLTGLSAERADRSGVEILSGIPSVTDTLRIGVGEAVPTLRLRRDVRAFSQGNRFLLEPLVRHVTSLMPTGPVVDLYAGVGLFGLSLAAAGYEDVTLVEGDPISGASLIENAAPFQDRVNVERRSVESFLSRTCGGSGGEVPSHRADDPPTTFIVDPPRTGMSKEAVAGIIRTAPARLIYVSCDVATFARDTRTLLDAGYELEQVNGMDLFPNTAHVEAIAAFRAGTQR
jgi:23S rRNA (uracil1939-C5)-methyltransferase